jgi:sulfotransferase
MRQFYFMAGLPRSGSTLISSILNQNPDIHASANSPMCGMMFNLERSLLASEQYNAYPKPQVMAATISGVLENYYSDIKESIVIDKSREWSIQEHFGVLLRNLPYKPKVILPVRDITDILASFINLVNQNPNKPSFIDQEIQARQEFNFYRPIDDIRCDHLMRPKGLIDNALYGVAYAMLEENREYFHLVEYEDLITNTKSTIDGIYDFFAIEKFEHDFSNIKNTVKEDDTTYGLAGMHEVRSEISRRGINKNEILSPYTLNKYSNMEFWRAVTNERSTEATF